MSSTNRRISGGLTRLLLVLVHSNLFISLATTGLAVSTILLTGQSLDPVPLFIVFAVTLFVYSFNRIADLAEDRQNVPGRADFVEQYGPGLVAAGGLLYLLAIGLVIAVEVRWAPAMALPLVVALVYSTAGLKRVLLVKNCIVGLAWGGIPLGVGVYFDILWTVEVWFMFAFVTWMLTLAAMLFDIKDIEGDTAEGIRTVPVVLGPRRTRHLATLGTLIAAVVTATLVFAGVLSSTYLVLLGFTGYVFVYSLVATPERTPLFYGFVVDGEHVALALVLLGEESLFPVPFLFPVIT